MKILYIFPFNIHVLFFLIYRSYWRKTYSVEAVFVVYVQRDGKCKSDWLYIYDFITWSSKYTEFRQITQSLKLQTTVAYDWTRPKGSQFITIHKIRKWYGGRCFASVTKYIECANVTLFQIECCEKHFKWTRKHY